MAVKVEVEKPKDPEITIKLPQSEAALLMYYICDNGSWDRDRGGQVAQAFYNALENAGVEEA